MWSLIKQYWRYDRKDTKSTQSDLEILTQLNADYLASDQNGDVQRYGQILAVSLSDRSRSSFSIRALRSRSAHQLRHLP
jgi:hypothetical protein